VCRQALFKVYFHNVAAFRNTFSKSNLLDYFSSCSATGEHGLFIVVAIADFDSAVRLQFSGSDVGKFVAMLHVRS